MHLRPSAYPDMQRNWGLNKITSKPVGNGTFGSKHPSLFKGCNGDVHADSLWRSMGTVIAGTAWNAWLTGSLNQQECCTSYLTGQWSQAETFEGIVIYLDRMKILHFILRYLCRAKVSKETNVANISYFGNTQMWIQATPLPKHKPYTTSSDHARRSLGSTSFQKMKLNSKESSTTIA